MLFYVVLFLMWAYSAIQYPMVQALPSLEPGGNFYHEKDPHDLITQCMPLSASFEQRAASRRSGNHFGRPALRGRSIANRAS